MQILRTLYQGSKFLGRVRRGGDKSEGVFALALFLLAASTFVADAAMRYGKDAARYGVAAFGVPSAALPSHDESDYAEVLLANGVRPDSNKAQLIVAWIKRIQLDPAIRSNAHSVSQLFADAQTRASLMADGLARLTPADRLRYAKLIMKFLDEYVPSDCFGFDDESNIMSRIRLSEVADADIEEYLAILLQALRRSALGVPIDVPVPQQYAAAEIALGRALASELGNDDANVARYEAYMAHPKSAAPAEACWGLRVTMHAIVAMPEPDRDVVLRYIVVPRGTRAAPRQRRPDRTHRPAQP